MKHTIIAGILLLGFIAPTSTGDESPLVSPKDARKKQYNTPRRDEPKMSPTDKKQAHSGERRRRKAEADRFIKKINEIE